MPQYKRGDDGAVVGGKTVVFMGDGPQSLELLNRSAKAGMARATAAMMASSAKRGVPFCEDCERARRALKEKSG